MTGTLPDRRTRELAHDNIDSSEDVKPGRGTRRRVRVTRRRVLAMLFAILGLGAVAISITGLPRSAAEPVELLTAKVERGDARSEVGGSGSIAAATTIELAFGNSTTSAGGGGSGAAGSSSTSVVRAVNVKRGQRVTRGQVLARLDQNTAQLALEAANRSYDAAVASRDNPTTSSRDGQLTQQQSSASLELAVAEAAVQLESAKAAFEATTLRAPSTAMVESVDIAIGNTPPSGAPAITLRTGGMQVVIDVPEDDIGDIALGQTAEIHLVALDTDATGKVASIDAYDAATASAAAVPGSGSSNGSGVVTYPVAVKIDEIPAGLRIGMSAEVIIVTASREDVLVVPVTAITGSGSNATARIPGDNDGEIESIPVEVGLVTATHAEIVFGLEDGDEVVTGIVAPESDVDDEPQQLGPRGGFGGPGGFGGGRPPGGFGGGPPGGPGGGQGGGGPQGAGGPRG